MADPTEPHPYLLLKGKYSLGPCIRRGGMGVVHTGWTVGASGFAQRIAIKQIHPEHSRDPKLREQFVTEARLGSHLRHANIVRVLDFDEDEAGALFLVMEHVDGVELDVLARTGRLPLPMALFIAGEILRGLSYVHDLPVRDLPVGEGVLGLVHRDVSPHNVLLSWDGGVQLSDFGIAKARTAPLASASSARGKDGYMSPEQADGLPLDGRSDVFSVGVVLWEMLHGEPLAHAPDELAMTTGQSASAREPRPAAWPQGSHLPRDAAAVLSQMLQSRPEDRCTAAAALAAVAACADFPAMGRDALAALLCDRFPDLAPTRGQPAPTVETQERPPPLPLFTYDCFLRQARRTKRRRALLVTMGTVTALSGAAFLALREPAAAEASSPALELPSPVEPSASPAVRFAAPERDPADPANEAPRPAPPRAQEAPSESPHAGSAPAVPGIRIIELPPETPEPIQTGAGRRSWVHL
jgi:serine/threonine protein kinase